MWADSVKSKRHQHQHRQVLQVRLQVQVLHGLHGPHGGEKVSVSSDLQPQLVIDVGQGGKCRELTAKSIVNTSLVCQ